MQAGQLPTYIDERRLTSTNELDVMRMNEIDEIYLNPHAIVDSINNRMGVIKIYRKQITPGTYNAKKNPNLKIADC